MIRVLSTTALAVVSALAVCEVSANDARPQVIESTYHGVSPAMRDIIDQYPPARQEGGGDYVVPNIFPKTGVPGVDAARARDHEFGVQRTPSGVAAPPVDLSVVGMTLASGGGGVPPDTNGDIGTNEYVQWINTSWAVFDRVTGVRTSGPTAGNSFWSSFPVTSRCRTTNSGDPIALWDDRAQRWLMTQFTTPAAGTNIGSQCVAVSQTADPLGAYNLYEFIWPAFGDYPHFGIWNDESGSQSAYVLVTHEFNLTPVQQFLGAAFIALDREAMLAGEPATSVRFPGNDAYGAMPAHLDGSLSAPAGACPAIIHFDSISSDYLFWDLCVDWETPANASISAMQRVPAGTPFVSNFTAIPQAGSAVPLDSFGSNLMYKASAWAYAPGSPTTISLVVNHAVMADEDSGAVKWVHFDLKPDGTTLDRMFGYGFDPDAPAGLRKAIVQEGAFAPDDNTRWMAGIAVDRNLNIGLGHNVGSAAISPKIGVTGRTFSDPRGEMRGEQECTPGTTGSQTGSFGGRGRWGDYSSMSVDPADECTFWFTGEYYATTSTSSWSTRICTFKFPECGLPDFAVVSETPTRLQLCAADSADAVTFGLVSAAISGFDDAVTLSANSVPAGLTATFSPSATSDAPAFTGLTLSGIGGLASGEYTFDVTGTSGGDTRSLDLELGVSSDAPASVTLLTPVDDATAVKVRPLLTWQAVPGALQYLVEIASDAGFANVVASAVVSGTSWASSETLDTETEYFWRVTANNYCGDGAVSAVSSFTTGVPGQCPSGTTATAVFDDDFQGGANGWVSAGTGGTGWTQQIPNPLTGLLTTSWGIPNNAVTSDRNLTSPTIAVPAGAAAVILSYDAWHSFETDGPAGCWDGASLEASGDGGATFGILTAERMFTDPYTGPITAGAPLAGRDAWCAATPSGSPTRAIVDLDDFAGQSLQLRFRASSDSNTTAGVPNGYYLDNLTVEVCQ
jgi:hypothetical protein